MFLSQPRSAAPDSRSQRAIRVVILTAAIAAFLSACTVRYGPPLLDGTPASEVDWIDPELYPYASNFLDVPAGKLHFVDEGPRSSPAIVFVHGTPTWSFLYRDVIHAMRSDHRCIAVDHLGFGLSSKPDPAEFRYSPRDHSENLIRLVDALDLEDVTLVVHDLGGPIGIAAALERPNRVARIVVINSFAWSLADNAQVKKIDAVLRSGFGEWLYLKRNLSPEVLLPGALSDGHELTEAVKRHYTHPFSDESSRHGLLEIGRNLLGESAWYAALWDQREALEARVKLLVFGLEDEFFGQEAYDTWRTRFPNAMAVGLEGVGHFPQEEAPGDIVNLLEAMLDGGANEKIAN